MEIPGLVATDLSRSPSETSRISMTSGASIFSPLSLITETLVLLSRLVGRLGRNVLNLLKSCLLTWGGVGLGWRWRGEELSLCQVGSGQDLGNEVCNITWSFSPGGGPLLLAVAREAGGGALVAGARLILLPPDLLPASRADL